MNTQFQAGKTYQARFICDYDSKINLNVISRTAKTIKATINEELKVITLRVNTRFSDFEQVSPFGTYSMSPVVSASNLI